MQGVLQENIFKKGKNCCAEAAGREEREEEKKVSNSDVRWKRTSTASNLAVSSRETFERETSSDLSGLVPRQY